MSLIARIGVGIGALFLFAAVGTADAARKPKDLLQYIPADTPYVIAFTRPLPDDLVDRMEPAMDETLSAYRSMIEFMLGEAEAELEKEQAAGDDEAPMDEEQFQRFEAVMTELMAMMSVQGLREAGIGRDALFAFYGDGLLPVVRIALTDGDKFDQAIARFEEQAEATLETAEIRGLPYRYVELDGKARVIIATPDDDAIIAVVPTDYGESRLALTLGLEKPRNSLYRSKELRKIAKEYDFTDHAVGFFDIELIAASLLSDPSPRNAELFALMEYDPSQLDDTCKAEFAELAGVVPRVVMGYTGVGDRQIEGAMIVELREDIAAGLATLPAAVPGLGRDPGGLFSFGFSLDPMALRTFYEARLDAMEEDPFQCAALAELQASTAQGRQALAKPLPPVVYNFRGMMASIQDIQGFDMSAKRPPESIDAGILFVVENAQDLVNMAALMSPQVAALNLLPDGKSRRLDLPELGEMAEKAFAALSSGAMSISVGEGAAQKAEAMLEADVERTSPLMSMSMDAKRYYEFVGQAMMQEDEPEEGEPTPIEVREAMRDVVLSSGSIYERMFTRVHLTSRGIEVDTRMTLSR
jgi:hypothetical protein